MPCAWQFAVSFLSGTRQRLDLPCASKKTHSKHGTLGKRRPSPCAKDRHTANSFLRRELTPRHTAKLKHVPCTCSCRPMPRRRSVFAVCLHGAHDKAICSPCAYTGHMTKPFVRRVSTPGTRRCCCRRQALGRRLTDVNICRVSSETRQMCSSAVCLVTGTQQTTVFVVCLSSAHDKDNEFFFIFPSKFFLHPPYIV